MPQEANSLSSEEKCQGWHEMYWWPYKPRRVHSWTMQSKKSLFFNSLVWMILTYTGFPDRLPVHCTYTSLFLKPVGCDNGIESGMKRDRCGICEGDSSECKFVQEFWNERCPGFGKFIAPFFYFPLFTLDCWRQSVSICVSHGRIENNFIKLKVPSFLKKTPPRSFLQSYFSLDSVYISITYRGSIYTIINFSISFFSALLCSKLRQHNVDIPSVDISNK